MKNDEIQMDIEKRLNKKQNQYLTDIIKLSKLDEETDTELLNKVKELQRDIMGLFICDREQKIDLCKEQLVRAFTPRIQKMLEK
jgi:flagellar basal body-associated protein FliL